MNKAFFSVWAKYFGYPACCAQEMLSYYVHNPNGAYGASLKDKRKFYGTGFIPCPKCNKISERHLKQKINRSRVCSSQFPYSLSLDESLSEIYISDKFSCLEKKIIQSAYR